MSFPTFVFPPVVACEKPSHGTFGFLFDQPVAVTNWAGRTIPKEGPIPIHSYWATCRETFHGHFEAYNKNGWQKFWFSFNNEGDHAANIMDMIRWMEAQLGTEPVKVSYNQNWRQTDTNGNPQLRNFNCLQFEMTDFWLLNDMRFEFFTAMLKTAFSSHRPGADPMRAIKASKYFNETMKAWEAFMKGNNWFDRPKNYQIGWYNNMYPSGDKKLRALTEDDIRLRAYYLSLMFGGDQWYKAELDIAPKSKAA